MEKLKHTKETTYTIELRLNSDELASLKKLMAQVTSPGYNNSPVCLSPSSKEDWQVYNELYDILYRRL